MLIAVSYRLLVLTLGAAGVVMLFAPRTAFACDCVRLKPLSAEVRREAPVIFTGTVVEIAERNEHTVMTTATGVKTSVRPIDRRVVFQVDEGWRAVVPRAGRKTPLTP